MRALMTNDHTTADRRTSAAAKLTLPVVLLLFGLSNNAAGMGPKPITARHRVLFNNLTAIQWNPLGIQTQAKLGYRYRLFDSDSILFKNAFFGVGALALINPAFARLGADVEFEPIAVLKLRVAYEQRLYFGTARMLQSFQSPYDEYDEDTIKARSKADLNYITQGTQLTLQAELKAKAGPIVLLNQTRMIYFDLGLKNNDKVFYVNLLDTVTPDEGWVLVNDGHLFYQTNFGLMVGLRHTLVNPFYRDLLDQRGNPNGPNHRLGPMAVYTFKTNSETFQNPTLIFMLNWWINNRYRNGQKINSAIPYGVLAFVFFGDLWTK